MPQARNATVPKTRISFLLCISVSPLGIDAGGGELSGADRPGRCPSAWPRSASGGVTSGF
jgi:hypothetical protein